MERIGGKVDGGAGEHQPKAHGARQGALPDLPALDAFADLVAEITAGGLVVLRRDLTVYRATPAFCETFDAAPHEVEGESFYQIMDGRWDTPAMRRLLEEELSDRKIVTGAEVVTPPEQASEAERWLANARRLDEYPLIFLAIVDPGEEHPIQRLEDVVGEELALLQQVLRDLPDIVSVYDVRTHANRWCNEHVTDILGYRPEEMVAFGSALLPFLVYPADLKRVYNFYTGYDDLDGDRLRQITCRMLHKDGGYRWLATRESVFRRGREGRVQEVLLVARDITEQKVAEQTLRQLANTLEERVEARTTELQQSEERFRALVDASAQILWTTLPSGAAVDVSESWGAFTGQTYDEARGWGWLDAVHPDDQERVEAEWRRSVASEAPVDAEFRLYHKKTQRWRWTHCRAVPLRHEDGTVRGWVGMNIDIDERKRAEKELLALNEALQEQAQQIRVLASELTLAEQQERRRISHILHDDLQQRLFGIQMKMVGIKRGARAGDVDTLLPNIEEAERWLSDAIRTTRQLSVDLSPPVLDTEGLTDVLRWLVSHMREMYNFEVNLEAEHDFHVVDADMRVLLFQIVRELLFNVVKHSGVMRATVRLEDADNKLLIHVMDEGRGFTIEEAAPLLKGQNGFGLISARERLRLFGGDVTFASKSGEGTRVTLTVPVE